MVSCEITGARASFAQGSSGRVCAMPGEWNPPRNLSTDGGGIRHSLAPPLAPPPLGRLLGDATEAIPGVDQLERVGVPLGEVEEDLWSHHAHIVEPHPAPAEEQRHRLGADQLLAGVERHPLETEPLAQEIAEQ